VRQRGQDVSTTPLKISLEYVSGSLRWSQFFRVQVNAFPPKPKTAVDLYTSCTHGDRDTTITLRFSTSKTLLTDEIPEVHVELVMGSFNSR